MKRRIYSIHRCVIVEKPIMKGIESRKEMLEWVDYYRSKGIWVRVKCKDVYR